MDLQNHLAMKTITFLLTITLLLTGFPGHSLATPIPSVLYVSPSGSDSGDGSVSNPFKTVSHARDVVRSLIAGGMNTDIIVYLRGGEYFLEAGLAFNESDSGRDGYTVTYRNYQGETPIFVGGRRITGWQPDGINTNIYKANVGQGLSFNTLYENGQRSVKARYPNTGYSKVQSMDAVSQKTTFGFAAADIPIVANPQELQIYVWPGGPLGEWNWNTNTTNLKSVDYTQRKAVLNSDAAYELGPGSRYFVQGAKELLDQAGEFYLDETVGILYYYPRGGDISSQEIVAPTTKRIVQFVGSSDSTPVRDIILDGITISGSDTVKENIGYITDGAVYLENAYGITVRNSIIENAGINGVSLEGYAQHNSIYGNLIHDIGFTGVRLQGAWQSSKYNNKFNDISNNHIYNTGQLDGGAVGIILTESGDNTVTHNRIHDSTRSGITFLSPQPRWLIGTTIDGISVTRANVRNFIHNGNNVVEYNDVFNVNTDSQDTGAIYAYGAGTGNIIRNNHVHDTGVPFSFGTGIYLDDAADGFIVENNVLDHMQKNPSEGHLNSAFMTKGIGNIVRNNIAADNNVTGAVAENYEMFGEPNNSLRYEHNIFSNSADSIYMYGNWDPNRISYSDQNLFYNSNGNYGIKGVPEISHFSGWRDLLSGKYDQRSRTEDPKFVDAANRDYRLRYDSSAYAVGVADIDLQSIGLKADFAYGNRSEALDRIYVRQSGTLVNRSFINLSVLGTQSSSIEVTGRTVTGLVADLTVASITYASDAANVATVDANGVIHAVSPGTARITVSIVSGLNTKSSVIDVLVDDTFDSVELISVKNHLLVNQSTVLQVYARTKAGQYINASVVQATYYTSSDPSIVSVDNNTGVIMAQGVGSATVTVTTYVQNEARSAQLSVDVLQSILSSIHLTMDKQIVKVGETSPLQLKGVMNDGQAADLTGATIQYTSSNTSVASVSGALVTAQAAGRATIQAAVSLNGVTMTAQLTAAIYPSDSSIPAAWTLQNYGNTEGLANYSTNDQTFTLASTGYDVFPTPDEFTYVYQTSPAADTYTKTYVQATVLNMITTDDNTSAGIMLRDSNSGTSKHMNLRVKTDGTILMVWRDLESGSSGYTLGPKLSLPLDLKLEREGNVIAGYYRQNSSLDWVELNHVTIPMNPQPLAGLEMFSRAKPAEPAEGRFTAVAVGSEPITFTKIAISADSKTLLSGESEALKVVGIAGKYSAVDLSGGITYTSKEPSIATIDQNGVVKGLKPGTVTIEAAFFRNGTEYKDQIDLVIIDRGSVNWALHKSTSASSEGWDGYLSAAKAVDGKYAQDEAWNGWGANTKNANEWWQVDLGEIHDVGKVNIQFQRIDGKDIGKTIGQFYYTDVPKSLTIRISEDGITWQDVISKTPDVPSVFTDYNPQLITYAVQGKARYIRIINEDGAQTPYTGFALSEVEVYEKTVIDKTAPTTTDNAPTDWVNRDVTVNLSAIDAGSGVAATNYTVDGGLQQTGNSVVLTAEGVHTIAYWSVDNAGNIEAQHTATIKIDKTAPVSVSSVNPTAPTGSNGWYTSDVTLSLSATDSLSGVTKIVYQVNNDIRTAYNGSIPAFSDGVYKVNYGSTDHAGNVEQIKTVEFKIDKTAPILTVQLDKPVIAPLDDEKMAVIHAALNASDATSGVASVILTSITSNKIVKDQGKENPKKVDFLAALGTSATSFSVRAKEGYIYTITYTITDNAGNKSTVVSTVSVKEPKENEADHKGNH